MITQVMRVSQYSIMDNVDKWITAIAITAFYSGDSLSSRHDQKVRTV